MILTEAETQALIVLIELADPIETPNNNFYQFYPKTMEAAAAYFRGLRLDWSEAFDQLCGQDLVIRQQAGYGLTEAGIEIARQVREDRPPIYYWYREFFPAAAQSQVYSDFCERLYGKNLCQAGFSDMAQVDEMIRLLNLTAGSRVLDLGCGNGMLAEYISDVIGARVWGMDYCPEAVEIAKTRTELKRGRLVYQIGNLDHLDYPEHFFDAIVSIDSLYMPNRLEVTLEKMVRLLRSGGQIAAFYTQMTWGNDAEKESLLPDKTPLGETLQKMGLAYTTRNFSQQTYQLMQRKRKIGQDLRELFEAEGSHLLYEFILNESEGSLEPYDANSCTFSRNLYQIRPPSYS